MNTPASEHLANFIVEEWWRDLIFVDEVAITALKHSIAAQLTVLAQAKDVEIKRLKAELGRIEAMGEDDVGWEPAP